MFRITVLRSVRGMTGGSLVRPQTRQTRAASSTPQRRDVVSSLPLAHLSGNLFSLVFSSSYRPRIEYFQETTGWGSYTLLNTTRTRTRARFNFILFIHITRNPCNTYPATSLILVTNTSHRQEVKYITLMYAYKLRWCKFSFPFSSCNLIFFFLQWEMDFCVNFGACCDFFLNVFWIRHERKKKKKMGRRKENGFTKGLSKYRNDPGWF